MEKVNDLLLEDEEMETILTLDKLLNYARIGMKYTKEINSKFVELDFEKNNGIDIRKNKRIRFTRKFHINVTKLFGF